MPVETAHCGSSSPSGTTQATTRRQRGLSSRERSKAIPVVPSWRRDIGGESQSSRATSDAFSSKLEIGEKTDWSKYGAGNDSRCTNCMVHCGFEASAIDILGRNPLDMWRTLVWNLSS